MTDKRLPRDRAIRYERIKGIMHALWDDGAGNREYKAVEDEHGEPIH